MKDAVIKFEHEGREGIVAVGTYLADAARRLGVSLGDECDQTSGMHDCAVVIASGIDNVSELTKGETEHFEQNGRRSNERLACQAKIIKPGEISIMTDQKKEEPKATETPKDKFQEEFEALPLEKKIASLLRMEAVTLGETFAYVVNSPMKVVEKVGDVIAEFGMKIENEARKAARPADTKAGTGSAGKAEPKAKARASKAASSRKSAT